MGLVYGDEQQRREDKDTSKGNMGLVYGDEQQRLEDKDTSEGGVMDVARGEMGYPPVAFGIEEGELSFS